LREVAFTFGPLTDGWTTYIEAKTSIFTGLI
jgi:hypothetical protein